jgi:hypothetical protein
MSSNIDKENNNVSGKTNDVPEVVQVNKKISAISRDRASVGSVKLVWHGRKAEVSL